MAAADARPAWQTDLEARRSDRGTPGRFAQIESLDNGKPLAVARVADVPLAVDLFRYMSGWTTKIEGQTISSSQLGSDYFAYTLREPVGVVGKLFRGTFHC